MRIDSQGQKLIHLKKKKKKLKDTFILNQKTYLE